MDVLARFLDFLDRSPTPLHATATAAGILEKRGFIALDPAAPPKSLPPGMCGYIRRDGTLFAFRMGRRPAVESGWRVLAAHTDSPNLRVKPQPVMRSNGYVRLGVEVYGGVQVATWADRDLGIAGVVHVRDGDKAVPRLVDVRRPIARVPTLAIHLNRKVNEDGLKLNKQSQLPAVLCQSEEGDDDPLRALLAAELKVEPEAVVTWDLSLFDLTAPVLGGVNEEFVFSARLDNLGSSHAALEALLDSQSQEEPPAATSVIALFDHEEIGSRTRSGAAGRGLETLLEDLMAHAEPQGPGTFGRALAQTWLLSADMAHAVHPAFADMSDPEHAPKMNAGPVIKQNANHRYSTEGASAAAFALLCERSDVPYQWFVNRSDLACGSTVGPMLSANLGVKALDVGNAMLSMHSVREQCGAQDHERMIQVMRGFLTEPLD